MIANLMCGSSSSFVSLHCDDMDESSAAYVLGGSENEFARLRAQAEEHEATARWLLDAIGVRRGWRVLDVGCGPIGILRLLADAVGPMARSSVSNASPGSSRWLERRWTASG